MIKPSTLIRLMPVMLTTFVAVLAAVYCVSWYFQAANARQTAIRLIANLNATQPVISYTSIETSGFPLDVNVHILQPKLSARLDALLPPRPPATGGAPTKAPEWIEEFSVGGSITFGVNLFSNRFTASVDGPVTYTSVINDARTTLVTEPQGPMGCMLELENRGWVLGNLWDVERLSRITPDEMVQNFRIAECSSPGYKLLETGTRETMLATGPFLLRLSNLPEGAGLRAIEAIVQLTDFEFSPHMNTVLNQHMAAFSGMPEALPDIDMAAYGKQNIDIAFALRGPADTRSFSEDTPFSLALPRFNISNALYSTVSSLMIENRPGSTTRSTTLVVNSDSSFSKAYDQYLADYARILVTRIKTSNDHNLAEIKNALGGLSVDQAVEALEPVIPKLHSFGNIALRVNASITGEKLSRTGNVTISTLELSTTPYGISMQGITALPQTRDHAPPNASFTLSCRNCLMLVDDAARYAQRLQQSFGTLDHSFANTPPYLSAPLAQGIQSFLSALGEKHRDPATNADLLAFTLTTDQAGNVSLNDKTPPEVRQIFNATIAPHLPAPPQGTIPQGGINPE